jgi:Glycoside hydrolase 123, catalytic domain/Glycoside hydrolase 123 N-terminal domain
MLRNICIAGILFASCAAECAAAEKAANVILDTGSLWRCHLTWRTEQVRTENGDLVFVGRPASTQVKVKGKRVGKINTVSKAAHSELPAGGWKAVDFDDRAWARARAPFYTRTTRRLGLLCMRGKFLVPKPAQAGGLTLHLVYYGGVVVYVNGTEAARKHLPEGTITPLTPAEDYPKDAYVDPDGHLLRLGFGDPGRYPERFKKRLRKLDVNIPASMLRKGTNVLGIELHRAPTAEVLILGKPKRHYKRYAMWTMAALGEVQLTASSRGGIVANVSRPRGLQVWNPFTVASVHNDDYGDPCETLKPVNLEGARNGSFSGQIVVSSSSPLSNLKVRASALKAEGGAAIPASAVELRYGLLGDHATGRSTSRRPMGRWTAGLGGKGVRRFDGLEKTPPSTVPIEKTAEGAVLPVWITVNVPKTAKPGQYTGKVTISVEGEKPVEAVVRLRLADWTLPDPKDFITYVGLVQSPETLALKYKVPMWSEEHWKLIDNSFRYMGQLGVKVVYLPVIRETYFGNDHSLVRWIKQPGGGWKHDFSIVEKYLDTAMKHLGKVPVVCVYCWDLHTGSVYMDGRHTQVKDKGMPFTILDPSTGNLTKAMGPTWGTKEIRPFWKPVMDGIRQRLQKRGIGASMHIGIAGDRRPRKNAVEDLKAVAPYAKWVYASHNMPKTLLGQPVGYQSGVWSMRVAPDPSVKRYYGWRNPRQQVLFPRFGSNCLGKWMRTYSYLGIYRHATEATLTARGQGKGLRGVGRCGADFWPVIKRRTKANAILGRFPESGNWHGGYLHNSTPYVLAPGKDGAVATARFEMLREGLQESEARIFIEKALLNEGSRARVGKQLADRCQALLDERVRAIRTSIDGGGGYVTWVWFQASGWQTRSAKLYELAADVGKKLNNN